MCRKYARKFMTTRFTFTFMHLADAFIQSDLQLHSGYTFFLISTCVPWESNPQPFAQPDAMFSTEPQRTQINHFAFTVITYTMN